MTTDEYETTVTKQAARFESRPKTGDVLPNGSTVLLVAGPGAGDYLVVLCQYGDDEYATWRCAPETRECFWGHYYRDPVRAAAGFLARAASFSTSGIDTVTEAALLLKASRDGALS